MYYEINVKQYIVKSTNQCLQCVKTYPTNSIQNTTVVLSLHCLLESLHSKLYVVILIFLTVTVFNNHRCI